MPEALREEDLLGANCTGFELDDLARVTRRSVNVFADVLGVERPDPAQLGEELGFIQDFYRVPRAGVYGGAISPGDAVVINQFIRALRPETVVEIGVASGFSSLLTLSSMKRHGLLGPGRPGLLSFDLVDAHGDGPERGVGHIVKNYGDELLPHWELRTHTTTIDLYRQPHAVSGATLAFIDGGHCHPWPLIDVFVLVGLMPPGSWILLQDVGLTERQLGAVIRLKSKVSAGYGFRGAQLLFEHYSGRKVRGIEGCFNMAAIQVPQSRSDVLAGLKQLLVYPPEKRLADWEEAFVALIAEAS